jgi:hypothetical protein
MMSRPQTAHFQATALQMRPQVLGDATIDGLLVFQQLVEHGSAWTGSN